ncbi:hypothetical protein ACH4E9_22555 [Streptomyces anulatus]
MSHDYVAILISVDAAVLLVATLQYGAMLRSMVNGREASLKKRQDRMALIIEARRNGVQPSNADLLELQRERLRLRAPSQIVKAGLLPYMMGSTTYVMLCGVLTTSIIKIIKWAGTAAPGPDPELAQSAFCITAVAVGALLIEAYSAGLVAAMRTRKALRRRLRDAYGDQEVDEVVSLVNAAQENESRLRGDRNQRRRRAASPRHNPVQRSVPKDDRQLDDGAAGVPRRRQPVVRGDATRHRPVAIRRLGHVPHEQGHDLSIDGPEATRRGPLGNRAVLRVVRAHGHPDEQPSRVGRDGRCRRKSGAREARVLDYLAVPLRPARGGLPPRRNRGIPEGVDLAERGPEHRNP